ncbi:MAG: LacI family DNA-binding transcriptional regulator [Verrucomicrobia bacterium]|nr:LacI family DNA-binding transcriptional regulator [Verrucomicrobiota bacterium]
MTTIKDVAVLAGVSFKTVSRVINRSPHVKEDVRQRVLRAADALEYRPHHHARHMRTQRSKVFGFLSDDIATTPFAGQIIQGAQEAAFRKEMLLLTFNTGGNAAVEQAAVEMAIERGVEGIIFATMYHRAVQVPKDAFRLPLVLVDCFSPDRSVRSVVPDEVSGGYSATKLLLEKGHRRIAMINANQKYPAAEGRFRGYRDALREYRLTIDPELVRLGGWWQDDGYEQTMALLKLKQIPTAIFCASDRIAMGAYDALKEQGLKIPGDMSVIGFDNQELLAAHSRPRLTTISIPYFEMGSWAVERLTNTAQDSDESPIRPVALPCPLIARSSVERPANRKLRNKDSAHIR